MLTDYIYHWKPRSGLILVTLVILLSHVACYPESFGTKSFQSNEGIEYDTRPGWPRIVRSVWPEDQSIITQTEFLDDALYRGEICVEWSAFSVVEPGDDWINWTLVDMDKRIRLLLNGHDLFLTRQEKLLGLEIVAPDGQEEARFASGYTHCWWAGELPAGHYESVFLVERTSGQLLGYTWQFEIRR